MHLTNCVFWLFRAKCHEIVQKITDPGFGYGVLFFKNAMWQNLMHCCPLPAIPGRRVKSIPMKTEKVMEGFVRSRKGV